MGPDAFRITDQTLFNDVHGFDGDRVNALCWSPEGVLYVGGGYGLFFLDGDVFVKIVGIIDPVEAVCCLPDHIVLAVSGRDVYVVKNDVITEKRTLPEDVFPGKRINGIAADPEKREVWLCSDDGMMRFRYENKSINQ